MPCPYLGDGEGGTVDLLGLQRGLGPGLDHVGAEQGTKVPVVSLVGFLVVWWRPQLCQHWRTVLLQPG